MKNFLILLVCGLSFGLQAQQKDVENTIKTFFEGFHAKDTLKIKSVCHDKMILQSIMEGAKGTKFLDEKASDFFKAIAAFPSDKKFEERLLKFNTQIDGAMAHVWTPYEFYIDGKLSHHGVNSFQLYKDNGSWKIIYVVDTRRK